METNTETRKAQGFIMGNQMRVKGAGIDNEVSQTYIADKGVSVTCYKGKGLPLLKQHERYSFSIIEMETVVDEENSTEEEEVLKNVEHVVETFENMELTQIMVRADMGSAVTITYFFGQIDGMLKVMDELTALTNSHKKLIQFMARKVEINQERLGKIITNHGNVFLTEAVTSSIAWEDFIKQVGRDAHLSLDAKK